MPLADFLMAGFERDYAPPPKEFPRPGTPEWEAENRELWREMWRDSQARRAAMEVENG